MGMEVLLVQDSLESLYVVSLSKTLYPLLSTGSTQGTGICPDMITNQASCYINNDKTE